MKDRGLFKRVFDTDDGRKVIAFLKNETFRPLSPDENTSEALWYAEGRRALVERICALTKIGGKDEEK